MADIRGPYYSGKNEKDQDRDRNRRPAAGTGDQRMPQFKGAQSANYDLDRLNRQQTGELGNIIKQQVDKKANGRRFEVNIEDEEFHNIPDVDVTVEPVYRPGAAGHRDQPFEHGEYLDLEDQPSPPSGTPKKAPARRKSSRKKQKKRTKIFGGVVYTLGVIGASILLAIFLIQSLQDFMGLFKENHVVEITLPDKPTVKDVAQVLKENDIISQVLTFQVYTSFKIKEDEEFVGGTYVLNSNMSYDELFANLLYDEATVAEATVTVIEGRTIREMAEILEENEVCDYGAFVDAIFEVGNHEPIYEWEALIPNSPERYFKLEGYLFPNTHTFWVGEDPQSVIINRYMWDFNQKLTSEIQSRAQELGMTLDELLTLASIIEREASGHEEEMDKVSAVFHNRLDNPSTYPKLQSDVTRDYVNDNIAPYVTAGELEMYAEAYSTYRCDGLPVGPICNPGASAIRAAMYPNDEYAGYYYFVTDVNDKFYYSATLSEHEYNISVAESVTDDNDKSAVGGIATGEGEQ